MVIPSIVEEKNALDCTNNTFGGLFGKDFKDFAGIGKLSSGINGQKIIKTAGMKDYLEGRLKSQFGDKYKGYTVLYFIGEDANWNGFKIMDGPHVFNLADIIKGLLLMKLFILYIYPILLPV